MLDIKFGTETVVYNVIEVEEGNSLGINCVYVELLRLFDITTEKSEIFGNELELLPEIKWLMSVGAFHHNENHTLSIGENFKEIKNALEEKKQQMFRVNHNKE